MTFKDYFSKQSKTYAKYRPHYPDELFEFLAKISPSRNSALDIATGTGQAAFGLISLFNRVYASDASMSQLLNVPEKKKIYFFSSTAEKMPIIENTIDLIICAQAIHWFNWEQFYNECKRILKKNGIIAIIGYGLPIINEQVDEIINDYYTNIVGQFWPKERVHIENEYSEIPFPFECVDSPDYKFDLNWKLKNVIGFLNSWSATQNFINKYKKNPVDEIRELLYDAWMKGKSEKNIIWPLFLKIGKLL